MTDPETKETLDAEGVLMTEIRCPACGNFWDAEGNCDRDIVECPHCNAQLCVTCK